MRVVVGWALVLSALLCCGRAPGQGQAALYVTRPLTHGERASRSTGARFEPAAGCYLGAFIDFDFMLQRTVRDLNGTQHRDPAEFEAAVGKAHAMYFFYLGYGRRLPADWVRNLAAQGKMVHIALEPNSGLGAVRDDGYLRGLAREMARSGARIFLRFASEMNGDWTVYHKDPALYRRKFQLVSRVMRREAPNVAMVWCPYIFPDHIIDRYYPGDAYTDWVGVNLYNVTYHDNDARKPAEQENPSDLLQPLYDRYSGRKPMMVCEYAATHMDTVARRSRPDFAVQKILTLYTALPRRFPRVKCINYFDGNNVQAGGDRACNDYSVCDDPYVKNAYRFAVNSSAFLSTEAEASPEAALPVRLRNGEVMRGDVKLSCWARSDGAFHVKYYVDGHLIYDAATPDAWECLWDSGSVRPGQHRISLRVTGKGGRLSATDSVMVRVLPALTARNSR